MTRDYFRNLSKKALLKLLGFNNLKSYAKDKLENGKISRKMLAKQAFQQHLDNA